MRIINYSIYSGGVELFFSNGTYLPIYFTEDSGRSYFRLKLDTLSDIKHPGIFLGVDHNDTTYFMENHYEAGTPEIVTGEKFTQGKEIYPYDTMPLLPAVEIIENGLKQIIARQPYTLLTYNCQSFVNLAAKGKNISEDVAKWVGGAFLGLILIGIGLNVVRRTK